MGRALSYVAALVLASAAFVSCGREEKVIPKDELSEIYAEMFLMDQWIFSHPEARRSADTSFVYEPIFEKYGYTSDDYRASMDYYLKDPDKYARILRETSVILETRLKELRQEKDMLTSLDRIAENRLLYAVRYDFGRDSGYQYDIRDSIEFYTDSSGCVLKVRQLFPLDTLYDGPALVPAADTTVSAGSTSVPDSSAVAASEGKDPEKPAVNGKPAVPRPAVLRQSADMDSTSGGQTLKPVQSYLTVPKKKPEADRIHPMRR